MKRRRAFFSKLAAIAAAVALAPEIAFGSLNVTKRVTEGIDELELHELFAQIYALRQARRDAGYSDTEIVIYCHPNDSAGQIFGISADIDRGQK